VGHEGALRSSKKAPEVGFSSKRCRPRGKTVHAEGNANTVAIALSWPPVLQTASFQDFGGAVADRETRSPQMVL